MSEKELVEFRKGEFGVDVDLVDGMLRLKVGVDSKGVDAYIVADLDPEYFLNKLAAAIPGTMDDALIAMLVGALKKV